ncbi:mitochondrial intermembrane space import and assembly protein 40 [Lophiotrema nucula]|uniref:Mitochondrial intermembrane space import and assembly protein 40 n=1 Tax=Lophiotrema nucula TaxID=690887 RepID=A0A6A5ZU81_9PLEO|nr:mitochondrial intermembrane space import and assembly protein 40 [Lophiotrema nucula]
MFRIAPRIIARSTAPRAVPRAAPVRRLLSTAPPAQKSRSWKSSAARWGTAVAVIYYYNTSDVFAEEPKYAVQTLSTADDEHEQYPTIDALSQQRRQRKAELAAATEAKATVPLEGEEATGAKDTAGGYEAESPEELEAEANREGAFNPETGEINWDCPCLGGMANGPCGEEFKAAFSCFVFSTEEPKGMDCIDKFKGMQSCFRQYPEIYGAELEPDEDDDVTADRDQPSFADDSQPKTPESAPVAAEAHPSGQETAHKVSKPSQPTLEQQERAKKATEQVQAEHGHEPVSESDDIVPKASHDASGETVEKK